MTPLTHWITPAMVSAVGWTLIHFVWQGLAMALVLRGIFYCLRTPAARYNAAVFMLAAMAIVPAVTFSMVYHPAAAVTTSSFNFEKSMAQEAALLAGTMAAPVAVRAAGAVAWFSSLDFSQLEVSRVVVWFWIVGVLTFSLRALGGWMMVRELRRKCDEQVTPALLEICHRLQKRLGVERVIRFGVSASLTVPAVVGWFRPVVLLPVSALSGLSVEQLEAVIAHELAHIRRFDAFVNLFQIGVETLLFYHPAVWWVSRSIREEREHCCDDVAVSLVGNPLAYAKALTLMEEWRSLPDFALAINSRPLKGRIERLLGIRSVIATASAGWPLGGVAVMAMVGIAGLLMASGSLRSETLSILEQRFFNSDTPSENQAPTPPNDVVATPSPEPRPVAPEVRPTPRVSVPAINAAVTPKSVRVASPAMQAIATPHAVATPAPTAMTRISIAYANLMSVNTRTAMLMATVQDDESSRASGSVPAQSFIAGMEAAGYKNLTVDQLLAMKIQGVTPEYAREMRAAGLALSVDQLVAMKIQGVMPAYLKELKAAGFDVDVNTTMAMKIQGVTPAYVKEIRATGLNPSASELVGMKIQGVTPEYVREIQAAGFKSVTAEQLTGMRIQGVKPTDAAEFEKLGFKEITVNDLVSLRIQGVTPAYVQGMRAAGYNSDRVHEYIGAKIQGITPEFIEKAKQHGFTNLSLHQLMALRQADVF